MNIEAGRLQNTPLVVSAHVSAGADWKNVVQKARKSRSKQPQRLLLGEEADKENCCPLEASLAWKDDRPRKEGSRTVSDEISNPYLEWETRLADWEARLIERDFASTEREQKVDEQSRSNEEKVSDLEVLEMRLASREKRLADSEAACSAREMSLVKREEELKQAECKESALQKAADEEIARLRERVVIMTQRADKAEAEVASLSRLMEAAKEEADKQCPRLEARQSLAPSRGCLDDLLRLAETLPEETPSSSTCNPITSPASFNGTQPKQVRFVSEPALHSASNRIEGVVSMANSSCGAKSMNPDVRTQFCNSMLSRSFEPKESELGPTRLLTTLDGHAYESLSQNGAERSRFEPAESCFRDVPRTLRDIRDPASMPMSNGATSTGRRVKRTAAKTIASRQASRQTSCCPSPEQYERGLYLSHSEGLPPVSRLQVADPTPVQDEKEISSGLGAHLTNLASRLRMSVSGALRPNAIQLD
mmetsp:Transcript_55815/g.88456  ORF Transcript_55815/g.88456 Transcript_55815/m.88456 type:complete len:479 (-) Transcript_55815:132-1568(-)|eukprot:CAMPEP_0169350918 /NCGR_PEP_ID=MMETSP1017-20121227/24505_1 /TAXON_ID=342587 /ORGANISM="Karlodinium micrum, Strain CCMP2283" /LENGTH=478 /DNA_ID=CAMNT_0009447151 /DNA_START=33 /DNA_END=1469 /DNA_ORIENTATION=-